MVDLTVNGPANGPAVKSPPSGAEQDIKVGRLPVGSAGRRASGWYGMLTMILTEAALFLYLLFSFYYTWIWSPSGFLPTERPTLALAGPNTVVLLLSSVAV